MVVVTDTCSLHRLAEYYLPFDRSGKLVPLLESLFRSGQAVMTSAVYEECRRLDRGMVVESFPFMRTEEFKKSVVKPEQFVPDAKLLRMVTEHFAVRSKYDSLPPEQQEAQRESFILGGDFSLLQCAYMKKKGLADTLFRETLAVLTDESSAPNDNKCFKKLPLCCKVLEVATLNIRSYLEYVTDGNIELVISG